MESDPRTREPLLALTDAIRQRAQRLLGEEGDTPDGEAEAERLADGPLTKLCEAFALSDLEYRTLLCLLAAEVEPLFRTLIRAQQREGGRPWLELGTIADLLELERAALPDLFELFLPSGKLRHRGLVLVDEAEGVDEAPMIHLRAKVTRRVLRYCLGVDELPLGMTLCDQPKARLSDALLPAAEREDLLGRVRFSLLRGERLQVALHGVDGVGKKFLAEALSSELGRAILFVDVRAWERRQLAHHLADVAREQALARAIPYFDGWEALVDDGLLGVPAPPSIDGEDAQPVATSRRPLPPSFVRFLEQDAGVVFLGARERYTQLDRLKGSVAHVALEFPGPSQRGRLWQSAISAGGATLAPGIDVDELGRKFALDPARILAATRGATALATLRNPGGAPVLGRDEIVAASRQQLQHELASLAVRVTKAHKWEDLVIPVDVYESLKELLSYVRHSADVYERQGFAARHSISPGLSALFAGPPGTGKTMCASIVARELEMELFRVDLSRIVSKWIGETEKNLAKVFDEAQRSHAVILFDEADSLFAKRTEVKSSIDRYANLEVSYLLQRMEQFSGVTVLTTNFEDTIDPAFKRRITFKMRFERPDAEARAALWTKMFPEKARLGDDLDLVEIGHRFELSGGSIRNAIVRAAFLAADAGTPILQKHLLLAAAREAREMGALVADPRKVAPPPTENGEHDDPPPPRSQNKPRMVPITRPRR
ncbi:MAG: ATP-binding protein [Myxococcales bacterium]|nr:ATP-binding protein [Myxococcales bacterium]